MGNYIEREKHRYKWNLIAIGKYQLKQNQQKKKFLQAPSLSLLFTLLQIGNYSLNNSKAGAYEARR